MASNAVGGPMTQLCVGTHTVKIEGVPGYRQHGHQSSLIHGHHETVDEIAGMRNEIRTIAPPAT